MNGEYGNPQDSGTLIKRQLVNDIRTELAARGCTVTADQLAAMKRFLVRLDQSCNYTDSGFLTALRSRLIAV